MAEILKPGTKIKPETSEERAKVILQNHYGIKAVEICELNSYHDRNFLIFADKNIKNPNIKTFCHEGYILKVLNSFDSHKTAFIEGQTELSLYLHKQKIVCPRQLQNIEGNYFGYETMENDQKYVIRVYEFIPGKLLGNVTPTANLLYHAGVYLGKMDNTLKNFHHEAFKNHKTLWMLTQLPKLEEFVYVVNEGSRGIVEDVIQEFKLRVLDNLSIFQKQMIHGDFHDQNILVGKSSSNAEYKVTGILDFGDTQFCCLLFDIAIALTHILLTSGNIEYGGYLLAGYKITRLIPEHEWKVLKLCVCARLCQTLVLGLYTYQQDPNNENLIMSQKLGWKLLDELHSRSDDDVVKLWNEVADEYLTQSCK